MAERPRRTTANYTHSLIGRKDKKVGARAQLNMKPKEQHSRRARRANEQRSVDSFTAFTGTAQLARTPTGGEAEVASVKKKAEHEEAATIHAEGAGEETLEARA